MNFQVQRAARLAPPPRPASTPLRLQSEGWLDAGVLREADRVFPTSHSLDLSALLPAESQSPWPRASTSCIKWAASKWPHPSASFMFLSCDGSSPQWLRANERPHPRHLRK